MFSACRGEHVDVEHGLFLFVPLCQFVSQPVQHLTIGILSKFLFCNLLSDTVGNRNSVKFWRQSVEIGFPLSMQIVQLLENWSQVVILDYLSVKYAYSTNLWSPGFDVAETYPCHAEIEDLAH